MKNLIYLLSIVLVATMFSCEEDDSNTNDETEGVNDGLITLAQLDGRWNFESYDYDDIIWDMESVIPSTSNYYGIDGGFDDWNFDTSIMIASMVGSDYPYILNKMGNVITISNNVYLIKKFTIISYSPTTLQLKFEDEGEALYNFKGGIYTLVR
jgi:hypothetical protein